MPVSLPTIVRMVLFLFLALAPAARGATSPPPYAVALRACPVLNTADFAGVFGCRDGKTLRTDPQGQLRALEFVALPGTVFIVREARRRGGATIYRVTTDAYPYPSTTGYFIDSRFVRPATAPPPARQARLPGMAEIVDRLLAAQGCRYVWGGNVCQGVPELLEYYPPAAPLAAEAARRWTLRGLDCSGLLYEATDGFTPRNTSALITYGRGVPIAGLTAVQIRQLLQPLDLLVWKGHVIIVLDRERTIESRLDYGAAAAQRDGVLVRPLAEVLAELMRGRVPADRYEERPGAAAKTFVVRRWYQ